MTARASASTAVSTVPVHHGVVFAGLDEHVAVGATTIEWPRVAGTGLADPTTQTVFSMARARSSVRQCSTLRVAGDPGGGHDERLGALLDQRAGQLGEAQVVAGHQAEREARRRRGARLERPGLSRSDSW